MRRTTRYSVDGRVLDIPSDRIEEFKNEAILREANPVEIRSFRVDGRDVDIPVDNYDAFMAEAQQRGAEVSPLVGIKMDDGNVFNIPEGRLSSVASMMRQGVKFSRKTFADMGLPDVYGRSAEERDSLMAQIAELFPEEEYVPQATKPDALVRFGRGLSNSGDAVRLNYEKELGKKVSGMEAALLSTPVLGSILEAAETGKEYNEQRLYNGKFRDSLEATRLALAIGLPEDEVRELNYSTGGDVDELRTAYKEMMNNAVIDRMKIRQAAGEKLDKKELNFLQNAFVGAVNAGKTIPEMASMAGLLMSSGVRAVKIGGRNALDNYALDEDGNVVVVNEGDEGNIAMAKGVASVLAENFIWGKGLGRMAKAIPGVGNAIKALERNTITRNGKEVASMVVKSRLTELVNDVAGMGRKDSEEKESLGNWAKKFFSVDENVKTTLEMLPLHILMKGYGRIKNSDARAQLKKMREVVAENVGKDIAKRLDNKDLANLHRVLSSNKLTDEKLGTFIEVVAEDSGASEGLRGAAEKLRKGRNIELPKERKAKARYERTISDEANFAIDEHLNKLVEAETIPEGAKEKVKARLLENVGDKKRALDDPDVREGEIFKAVDEIMEGKRKPERVDSAALERRQVEAKMRENEYWAKRSEELAAEYGKEEAEKKLAEEKAAVKRKEDADKVAEAEHSRKANELHQAFKDAKKKEDAEWEAKEAERKRREKAEEEGALEVGEEQAQEEARQKAAREEIEGAQSSLGGKEAFREEYDTWLRKHGRKDSDKNWNRFVAEHELDPALRVDRGKNGDAEPKAKVEEKPIEEIDEIKSKLADGVYEEGSDKHREAVARLAHLEGKDTEATRNAVKVLSNPRATSEARNDAISKYVNDAIERGISREDIVQRVNDEVLIQAGKDNGKGIPPSFVMSTYDMATAAYDRIKPRENAPVKDVGEMSAKDAKKILGVKFFGTEKELQNELVNTPDINDPKAQKKRKALEIALKTARENAKKPITNVDEQDIPPTNKKPITSEDNTPTTTTTPTTTEPMVRVRVHNGKGKMVEKKVTQAEAGALVAKGKGEIISDTNAKSVAKEVKGKKVAPEDIDRDLVVKTAKEDPTYLHLDELYKKAKTKEERAALYDQALKRIAEIRKELAKKANKGQVKTEKVPDGKGKMVEVKKPIASDEKSSVVAKPITRVGKDGKEPKEVIYNGQRFTIKSRVGQQNIPGDHTLYFEVRDSKGNLIAERRAREFGLSREEIISSLQYEAESYANGNTAAQVGERIKKNTAFAKMKAKSAFKKIDFAKLPKGSLEDSEKLINEYAKASAELKEAQRDKDDIEMLDIAQKKFNEAEEALNRFVEQADKYQRLKRDKDGRPIFTPNPEPKREDTPLSQLNGEQVKNVLGDEEAELGGIKPSAKLNTPLNEPPQPLQGSKGNETTKPSYDPQTGFGAGVDKPVHRREILDKVKELFKGLVAIRGKNTTPMPSWAGGHFEPDASIIRSKDVNSLRTIPHEIGHFIHYLYEQGAVRQKGRAFPFSTDVGVDLVKMGHALYGDQKPNGGYQREGMAELFKFYMQDNLAGLKKDYPHAVDWFMNDFAKKHPNVMAKVDEIRDMVNRYTNQSPEQAVKGAFVKKGGVVERALKAIDSALSSLKPKQEDWLDDSAFIMKGIRAGKMESLLDWQSALKRGDIIEADRIIRNHPTLKWKLYKGKAGAKAFHSLKDGLTNLLGTRRYTYKDAGIKPPEGKNEADFIPSMREIFSGFTNKEIDDWQVYAIARVFKENYHAKGLESGISKTAIDKYLATHGNNPKYEKALKDWTDYNHAILHLLVDSGAISQAAYDKIIKANPIYTKIMRHEDSAGLFKSTLHKAGLGGRVVNKRVGSGRQIEDLFVATIIDHERIIAAAQQADVVRSLIDIGLKGEAIGTKGGMSVAPNWIHEVPNAKERISISAKKVRSALEEKIGKDPEIDNIINLLTNGGESGEAFSIFREKPSNGKNGIVSVYDQEGILHTYELPEINGEAWAKSLMGFTDPSRDNILQTFSRMATSGVRAGATMLNPTFAVRNLVRDSLHGAVLNEYGTMLPVVGTLEGVVKDVLNTDTAKLFKQMGLEMGTFIGPSKLAKAQREVKMIRSSNWFKEQLDKGIIKGVADLVGFSENGTRIKTFNLVRKWALKHGMSEDAANMLAGANALDITIDFQRMGTKMKQVNKAIVFANAGVQGFDQFGRALGILRAQPWQLTQGSVFEKGNRAGGFKRMGRTFAKGAMQLSTIALGSLAYAMADDERWRKWKELPAHEKWNYVSFDDVRLPVPFELGYAFMSIPVAVVAEMNGDEGAVGECISTFAKSLPIQVTGMKDMIRNFSIASPIVDIIANEDWKKTTIVPQRKMENSPAWEWYGPKTSKAAIAIGKALAIAGNKMGMDMSKSALCAPAYIQTFLDGYTGSLFSKLSDVANGDVDWSFSRKSDIPVVGTFFRRENTSRVVNDFYDRAETLTRKYNDASGISNATPEEYGEKILHDELMAKLSPIWNENHVLMVDNSLSGKERNDRIDANIAKAQDMIRKMEKNPKDMRRLGIARAAAGLSNPNESDSKANSDRNVLKGIDLNEAIYALRRYGMQAIPDGKGRMKRRWSDEVISKRIYLLRRNWDK